MSVRSQCAQQPFLGIPRAGKEPVSSASVKYCCIDISGPTVEMASSMGGISGLNHLTLSVANLDRSLAFYSGLLGLAIRWRGPAAAYLETETLWLALVVDADVRRGA